MSISSKPALRTPTSLHGSGASAHPQISAAKAGSSAAVALNMVWQLVVVIVLPIVGGHLLDVKFKTSPVLMCIGMAVAIALMLVVVRSAMRELTEIMNQGSDK